MPVRKTTRSTVQIKYFSTAGPTPTILRGAVPVKRSSREGPQNRPWLTPPASWPGPQTEWACYWYLSVRGIEPGRRKLKLNIDYLYQGGLAAPGLFANKPFTRGDFVIFNYGKGRRGVVLDPITPFTHPTPWLDLRKRAILALQGWQVIFVDAERLTAFPGTVIEQALRGIDESRLGRALGGGV
jgi:hypothetical protein